MKIPFGFIQNKPKDGLIWMVIQQKTCLQTPLVLPQTCGCSLNFLEAYGPLIINVKRFSGNLNGLLRSIQNQMFLINHNPIVVVP